VCFPLLDNLDSVQIWLEQTSMIDKSSHNIIYGKWFIKSEGVACWKNSLKKRQNFCIDTISRISNNISQE
jgi:hypothetical protein